MKNVRVRFAPSPTGSLHVGGARTAIFNWLFARSQGGKFILRIEDTDQARYDADSESEMLEDLKWLGLEYDEGPDAGGEFGPYRQSERLSIYREKALELVKKGMAYYCFCTSDRLNTIKEEQKANKNFSGYDRHCRDLDLEEATGKAQSGAPYAIRLKVPLKGDIRFKDLLRGEIKYRNSELDDIILLKTDGYPSYNFANVIDDHLMEISHVLRGEEFIPSTPKHKLLYESFGWEPPVFVHLPIILAKDGGKLSKRKGAASVTDFKNLGYLPWTLVNYLSFLGWNPGDDREIMEKGELIGAFSLERINPKSCAFDEKKLMWMNGQYIGRQNVDDLMPQVEALYRGGVEGASVPNSDYLRKVVTMLKGRVKQITDFKDNAGYFFTAPAAYEEKPARKYFKEDTGIYLSDLSKRLEALEPFIESEIEEVYRLMAADSGMENAGKLIHPTRLALTGTSSGPGLFELMELLGKNSVVERLHRAVTHIQSLKL